MRKKVIKLNENDIENLVKKIIKEDDSMGSYEYKRLTEYHNVAKENKRNVSQIEKSICGGFDDFEEESCYSFTFEEDNQTKVVFYSQVQDGYFISEDGIIHEVSIYELE
jgi:hypothetical protein